MKSSFLGIVVEVLSFFLFNSEGAQNAPRQRELRVDRPRSIHYGSFHGGFGGARLAYSLNERFVLGIYGGEQGYLRTEERLNPANPVAVNLALGRSLPILRTKERENRRGYGVYARLFPVDYGFNIPLALGTNTITVTNQSHLFHNLQVIPGINNPLGGAPEDVTMMQYRREAIYLSASSGFSFTRQWHRLGITYSIDVMGSYLHRMGKTGSVVQGFATTAGAELPLQERVERFIKLKGTLLEQPEIRREAFVAASIGVAF